MKKTLQMLGIRMLIGTTNGSRVGDFWSVDKKSMFCGAPHCFNDDMSQQRFEDITAKLSLTSIPPPAYEDCFHEVREWINAFNDNMKDVFIPSWISCLDESISIWTNRYTCPGWMFVPRKPHPMGNEYHTMCDGYWGVLYHMELMEGKHRPKEMNKKKFDEYGKTVGRVLRCSSSLFATGKTVVMDSGFCVLDVLPKLKERGVYALIMVKKRGSWLKGIEGEKFALTCNRSLLDHSIVFLE